MPLHHSCHSSPRLSWTLLRFFAQPCRKPNPVSEQGLTLIECLVAIVVISITIVAITPPVFLATATRVQSRKAERAMQIAQAEVDRVRVLVERGSYTLTTLPADAGTAELEDVAAATPPAADAPISSPASCNTYPQATPANFRSMIRVDVNGDCVPEYAMQVFRTTGTLPVGGVAGTTPPINFEIGVRVYSFSGDNFTPAPLGRGQEQQTASLITGTGQRENTSQGRYPMAIAYSAMARNDDSRSLGRLCRSASTNAAQCGF
jgi:prepilin-type N-terminal cleavage/methylation domain-containing protein